MKGPGLHMWVVCEHIAQDMDFVVILYLDLKVTVPLEWFHDQQGDHSAIELTVSSEPCWCSVYYEQQQAAL